jgi:hypothetical protein
MRIATVAALIGVLALIGCSPAVRTPVPTSAPLSQQAVDHARELGGVPHQGETLYLVMITSDASEAVVATRYAEAAPHFGDAADYFVILESQWFPELQSGSFVLAEVYSSADEAQESQAWWDGRIDASWYRAVVQKVTVETTSPIPVVYLDVG